MPELHIKEDGTWKKVKQPYIKEAGVWKPVKSAYIKEAGVWKKYYESFPGFGKGTVDNFQVRHYKGTVGPYTVGSPSTERFGYSLNFYNANQTGTGICNFRSDHGTIRPSPNYYDLAALGVATTGEWKDKFDDEWNNGRVYLKITNPNSGASITVSNLNSNSSSGSINVDAQHAAQVYALMIVGAVGERTYRMEASFINA